MRCRTLPTCEHEVAAFVQQPFDAYVSKRAHGST
jgi:hypothetical protein